MADNNIFDNDLRSRFEGFAPEPPADAWFAIQDAIVVAPAKRMMPAFFKLAAAVAFLAISGLSVWLITSDKHSENQIAEHQSPVSTRDASQTDNGTAPSDIQAEAGLPATLQQQGEHTQPGTSIVTHQQQLASASYESSERPAAVSITRKHSEAQEYTGLSIIDDTGMRAINPVHHAALSYGQAGLAEPKINANTYSTSLFAVNNTYTNNTIDRYAYSDPRGTGIVLGVHVAPQYTGRHIAEPFSNMPLGGLENQSMSYSYGFFAAIPISSRLSVQTGLGYMNVNQHINDINAFSQLDDLPFYDAAFSPGYGHPQNIVTSLGIIQMNNPQLYFTDNQSSRVLMSNTKIPFEVPDDPKFLVLQGQKMTQFFRFVEVPVVVRYRLFENRFVAMSLKAGVAGNFLIKNEVALSGINSNDEIIGETYGVRDFSYSGVGGFAIAFPLTQRLFLFVEPTAQMFLQPIVKDQTLPSGENTSSLTGKTYPYCFSVNSGISFRF